jgi:hypothetical protein
LTCPTASVKFSHTLKARVGTAERLAYWLVREFDDTTYEVIHISTISSMFQ